MADWGAHGNEDGLPALPVVFTCASCVKLGTAGTISSATVAGLRLIALPFLLPALLAAGGRAVHSDVPWSLPRRLQLRAELCRGGQHGAGGLAALWRTSPGAMLARLQSAC